MELLPSIQSETLVEPAMRGVHDHEDTISRMGGIGAVLAAHRVRFGLRRSLRCKDVATPTISRMRRGSRWISGCPLDFSTVGQFARAKRAPICLGAGEGAEDTRWPNIPFKMVWYLAIGIMREDAILYPRSLSLSSKSGMWSAPHGK